ncbi:MAG: response regulator [Thermoguttaceae bacterium]|jgi:PAS domain S-box-containing protein|nr:response regulator [Thermoguttaceae bacterium]
MAFSVGDSGFYEIEPVSAPGQTWSKKSRRLALAAVAVTGLLVALVLLIALRRQENDWIDAQFRFDAQLRVGAMERELTVSLAVLDALAAFHSGSRQVEVEEFEAFTKHFMRDNRGTEALAWLPRQASGEDAGNAQVDPAQAGSQEDAPTSAGRFVIEYVVPPGYRFLREGEGFISNKVVHNAMEAARDSGNRTIVSSVYFSDEEKVSDRKMIAFTPVYLRDVDEAAVDERRGSLQGFYVGVFKFSDLMQRAIGFGKSLGIDVQIYDHSLPIGRELMYWQASPARIEPFLLVSDPRIAQEEGWGLRSPLNTPGCDWSVLCTPTDVYWRNLRRPLPTASAVASLLVTGLLMLYLNDVLSRAEKVERLVVRRTGELREANRQLAAEIAERERTEQGLRDSEALYSSLVENLPVHVLRKDCQGRFTFANRSFCALLGRSIDEIVGKTDFNLYPEALARKYRRDDQSVAETGRLFDDEEQNVQDGRTRYVHVMKSPVRDAAGKIVGIQVVFWDVTERKEAEAALERAKLAAEAASRAKSAFLANVSHEIRTPMNAILGMTELVLGGPLTPHQREHLSVVKESGESLVTVINDILDFSKIEAGKYDVAAEAFDLYESLGGMMKFLSVRAHEKSLEIAYRILPGTPRRVVGDSARLRQIIVNLVGNAIKFTHAGQVIMEVSALDKGDDRVWIDLSVIDTGIGIPRSKLTTIFGAFEQADASTTRQYGGTGLGLAITRKLVELLGGTIRVESEEGKGSVFRVVLPFERAAEEPLPKRPDELSEVSVLIVDDNAAARQILQEALASWNVASTAVAGAEEALVRLADSVSGPHPFDVVLIDSTMSPDGFALAEQIIADSAGAARVIMMLTSSDRAGDVARCEEMGAAGSLTKPIRRSELLNAIISVIGIGPRIGEHEIPAIDEVSKRLRPLKILVAEDSLVGQKLVCGILDRNGHSVALANTGRAVIEKWQSESYDVVLMDVQMPEMDGLDATAAIRRLEAGSGRRTPIIAMTAHAMRGDQERCLTAGMDGYVSKPIHFHRLFEAIADVLGPEYVAEGAAAGPVADLSSRAAGQAEGPQPEPGVGQSADALFDPHVALATVGGDEQLLREVIQAYLEEAPRTLAALADAVKQQDALAFRRAAHTLKGSMRYFGVPRGFDLAFSLEKMGLEGRLQEAGEGLASLRALMEQLAPCLLDYLQGGRS